MSEHPGADKRRYRRFKAPVLCRPVGLKFRSWSAPPIDISWGGLRVLSHFMLEVGEQLKLAMTLPDGASVSFVAEVVWVEPLGAGADARCELGLKFLALDDDAKIAIGAVLAPYESERPGEP